MLYVSLRWDYSVQKMISGWFRIIRHNEDRYTKICYREQLRLAENNVICWGLEVNNILCSLGFNHVWNNQGVGNEEAFMNAFKQRLLDIDRQTWTSEIQTYDSLRTYILFKNENFAEPYVWMLNKFNLRKYLAKLRCGSLEVEINEGRKCRLPYDQRICKYCNYNQIDDEFHFLFTCPFLNDLRMKYIPGYYVSYPDLHKFINLLNSDCKKLCKSLALFIMHAMRMRAR